MKSPLAPQPVPQKLDSMPPSKGPFSANIHPITPKLSVPIGHLLSENGGGPLRKCTDWGQKSIWNHPSVPLKLDSVPPYKGPFSAAFPNFCAHKCAFGKWWGAPFENERLGAKIQNHHKDSGRLLLKVHFPEVISPRICIWSFPTLLCV